MRRDSFVQGLFGSVAAAFVLTVLIGCERPGDGACGDDASCGAAPCSTGSCEPDVADSAAAIDASPDAADIADAFPELTGPRGPTLQGTRNPCGGLAELLDGDVRIHPGDPCECGGVYVCAGTDVLRCQGGSPPDACGGCSPFGGAPGETCGPCGDGVLRCEGPTLLCDGASGLNGCGGCQVLRHAPGGFCNNSSARRFYCAGPDTMGCDYGRNACGGSGRLVFDGDFVSFDDECSTPCGRGTVACAPETLAALCLGPAEPNACGGCSPLAALPGTPCGCDGRGRLACAESGDDLVCVGGTPNACGGCGPLVSTSGESCGTDGVTVCAGPDTTLCVDRRAHNACGGVGELNQLPVFHAGRATGASRPARR